MPSPRMQVPNTVLIGFTIQDNMIYILCSNPDCVKLLMIHSWNTAIISQKVTYQITGYPHYQHLQAYEMRLTVTYKVTMYVYSMGTTTYCLKSFSSWAALMFHSSVFWWFSNAIYDTCFFKPSPFQIVPPGLGKDIFPYLDEPSFLLHHHT